MMKGDRNLRGVMKGHFLWGFSLAVVFGVIITLLLPSGIAGYIEVEEVNQIDETVGCDVITESWSPESQIVLVNSTPFKLDEDWEMEGETVDYRKYDELWTRENTGGLDIGLENVYVTIGYKTSLLISNQSNVVFHMTIRGLIGLVEAEVSLSFLNTGAYPNVRIQVEKEIIEPGVASSFDLNIPVESIYTDREIRPLIFGISFNSSAYSSVSIQEASIVLTSSEPLCPVTFDAQSLDGDSLFESPVSPSYGEIIVRQTNDSSYSGRVYPRRVNETIFLEPGNYSIRYSYLWTEDELNCSFSVYESRRTNINLRTSYIRLDLDIEPDLPYVHLAIHYGSRATYSVEFYLLQTTTESVFIPYQDEMIQIRLSVPRLFDERYPRILYFHTEIHVSAAANLNLEVRSPFFSFVGVTFAIGELIAGVFGLSILFATFTRNTRMMNLNYQNVKFFIRKHWSGLCILLSLFLPWFSTSNVEWYSEPPISVYQHIIGPGILTIEESSVEKAIITQNNLIVLLVIFLIAIVIYRDQQKYGWSFERRYGLLLGFIVSLTACIAFLLGELWKIGFGILFLIVVLILRVGEIVIYPRISQLVKD